MEEQWYQTSRRTHFPMQRGMNTMHFVHKIFILAVKRLEFVSDRMSYVIVGGCCFHIIGLNVNAPTEDKIGDIKDSFYEALERIFEKFPKYMTIFLGDFSAKVGREDVLKPTIGNDGVRVVSFATLQHS
jgi:hypothetical protein